ncbi:GAF domain-containing protein [Planococcus salinus]|uniref:GAF domain-containing protein n=1 Tax=Planococcus salinus TaxID=1848460 RepID=A0A3M8PC11_9BACL|nr:GAF domain-containing protein [Planococcus salinus]RNF41173.1 GAF domain-containing protein [Planococcus salinus]
MKNKEDCQAQIDKLRMQLDCDVVALAFVEPAQNLHVLKWQFASGNQNNRLKKIVLQSGKGVAGVVFKTGKPMLIENVLDFAVKDDLFNFPILTLENLKSIGAVPIWHKGRVAGVLLAGHREPYLMTAEKNELLKKTADQGIGNLDGKELTLN